MAKIWIKFIVVDSLTKKVLPKDCMVKKCISSGTTEAVKEAFPGCAVSVWDGKLWREVNEDTEALVVEDASLKAVRLAPAVADSKKLQAIYNMVQEMTKEKSPVSISKIDINIWLRVEANADLKRNIIEDIQVSVPKETVPAFDWDDCTESAQSVRYMSYLDTHISINPEENGWVDAADDPHLLSYDTQETLGFNFRGTTDVLVATRTAIRSRTPEMHMLLLFDLKKNITKPAVLQASVRLILANLHSPKTKPAMMLTDLRDKWQLLWLDGSALFQHPFTSRSQAVGFIEDFLARRIEASEGVHPSAARVAKRRKIERRLMPGAAASALLEEQLDSLEGVVDPRELRQMQAVNWLRQLMNSNPTWRPPPEDSLPRDGRLRHQSSCS